MATKVIFQTALIHNVTEEKIWVFADARIIFGNVRDKNEINK